MSNPFKVVVTDFVEEPASFEREILGDIAEVKTLQAMGEENLAGKVEDADAIMLYHYVTITRPTIERLTNCRLIVRCGVGYDNIDHVFARERGIDVANVPDYGSEEVADSAIGMALALAASDATRALATTTAPPSITSWKLRNERATSGWSPIIVAICRPSPR